MNVTGKKQTQDLPAALDERFDWRRRWRQSPEYLQLQGWFGVMREKNGRARFAAYCREARDGGDEEWLKQADGEIYEWIAYLQDMRDAAQSAEATERIAGHDGRDDVGLPPRLSVVKLPPKGRKR